MLAYWSAVVLPSYPPGKALGFFGGLQFGLGLKRTDVRAAFDATLGRTVTMAYAGQPRRIPSLRTRLMRCRSCSVCYSPCL